MHELTVFAQTAGCILAVFFLHILRTVHKELSKYGQPHEPGKPTTKLITAGPFQYSRNPTYTASTSTHAAWLGSDNLECLSHYIVTNVSFPFLAYHDREGGGVLIPEVWSRLGRLLLNSSKVEKVLKT
jgi:protein-S-isoprenylcysteine O-methyltransferase Ste14